MSDPVKPRALIALLCGLLGVFCGLCTIFVVVVTVAQAWGEHSQQSWPEVTAAITRCEVRPYSRNNSNRSSVKLIECQIHYLAGDRATDSRLRSGSSSVGSEISLMNQWVNDHESGSAIVIHYDPSSPNKAVLINTDMPFSGPHTPNNLKLLMAAAISSFVLLVIAALMRSRSQATT